MTDTTNFSLHIDNDPKKQQSKILFTELGINLIPTKNVLLNQAAREEGFPFFKVRLGNPNMQTIAAMEEALALIADKNTKKYSVEEALQELKK